MEIRRGYFPEGHPKIAQSLNNIGYYCLELGDYGNTLGYCSEALELYRGPSANNEFSAVKNCYRCGLSCLRMGRPSEALRYLLEAADACGSDDGGNTPKGLFSALAEAHAALAEEQTESGDAEGASLHSIAAREALGRAEDPDVGLKARIEALFDWAASGGMQPGHIRYPLRCGSSSA